MAVDLFQADVAWSVVKDGHIVESLPCSIWEDLLPSGPDGRACEPVKERKGERGIIGTETSPPLKIPGTRVTISEF